MTSRFFTFREKKDAVMFSSGFQAIAACTNQNTSRRVLYVGDLEDAYVVCDIDGKSVAQTLEISKNQEFYTIQEYARDVKEEEDGDDWVKVENV